METIIYIYYIKIIIEIILIIIIFEFTNFFQRKYKKKISLIIIYFDIAICAFGSITIHSIE